MQRMRQAALGRTTRFIPPDDPAARSLSCNDPLLEYRTMTRPRGPGDRRVGPSRAHHWQIGVRRLARTLLGIQEDAASGHHCGGALPDRRTVGGRRHGIGLSGRAPLHRAARRAQGARVLDGSGPHAAPPLPGRGSGCERGRSPRHHRGLRCGRAPGWAAIPGHGVPPGLGTPEYMAPEMLQGPRPARTLDVLPTRVDGNDAEHESPVPCTTGLGSSGTPLRSGAGAPRASVTSCGRRRCSSSASSIDVWS